MRTSSQTRAVRLSGVAWLSTALALAACDDPRPGAAAAAQRGVPAKEASGDSNRLRLDPEAAERAGVRVMPVALAGYAETTTVFGTVEANRDRFTRITPPVGGRVSRVGANLGDQVAAGAALVTLESTELGEARAAHHQAQTEVGVARAHVERTQDLVRIGAIAQRDAQRARVDLEKAQAILSAAAGRLSNLGVGPAPVNGAPSNSLAVTAPFGGTVIEKAAVSGAYAQPYQSLFTIADLGSLWIETNLYDRDLGDVGLHARATVTVDAYPERRFTGRVTYISSLLDPSTRTVKARVEVDNADLSLKPGMFANVRIERDAMAMVMRVPETALVLVHGQMTAFVQHGDGFEPRPVETGERVNGDVTVRSGLVPGETVVVSGAYLLKARMLTALLGGMD